MSPSYEPVPFVVHEDGVLLHGTRAELAASDGPGRIYVVEPTGEWEDDPNVTDKLLPGWPTCGPAAPRRSSTRRGLPRTSRVSDPGA